MDRSVNLAPTDQEKRLLDMLTSWAVIVDMNHVVIDDLLNSRPGAIIRCSAPPGDCIQLLIAPNDESIGCVAGWVSDEA